MSDPVSESVFGLALTQGADSSTVQALPGQAGAANVRALLFDSLRAQAGSGASLQTWRIQVLTLPLNRPSRRRVRVTLRGQLTVVRLGQARASLGCESRRVSALVLGREQEAMSDGALPTRERSLGLSITLPRSVRPRQSIRLVILLEADATDQSAQAEAVVDSVDVEAL